MKRRKSQPPKIFVVKDTQGRKWTTKEGLKFINGIYALDYKMYFYELGRKMKNV